MTTHTFVIVCNRIYHWVLQLTSTWKALMATSSKFCCVLGCLAQSCSRNCQYSRLPEFYKPISWVKSLEKGRLEMFRRVASFRSYFLMIGSSARIEALHLVGVTILLHGSLSLVSTVSEQKCLSQKMKKQMGQSVDSPVFLHLFCKILVRILLDCNGRDILKNQASEATCDGAPKQAAMAVLYVMRSGDVACREVPSFQAIKGAWQKPCEILPSTIVRLYSSILLCHRHQGPHWYLGYQEVPNQQLKIEGVTILVRHFCFHNWSMKKSNFPWLFPIWVAAGHRFWWKQRQGFGPADATAQCCEGCIAQSKVLQVDLGWGCNMLHSKLWRYRIYVWSNPPFSLIWGSYRQHRCRHRAAGVSTSARKTAFCHCFALASAATLAVRSARNLFNTPGPGLCARCNG